MAQLECSTAAPRRSRAFVLLLGYSFIGLFLFFVAIEIGCVSTIPLDHAATAIVTYAPPLALLFVCGLMLWGAIGPIRDGSWRRDLTTAVFAILKWLGVGITAAYFCAIGPAALHAPDMLPFLFEKLVMSVGVIVSLGTLALLIYTVAWLVQLPEPMAASTAIAAGFAEMFLPAILLKDSAQVTKFVAGVVSVSQVLFLSASLPCVLATSIPLGLRQLAVVWLQRTVLSILLAAPLAWLMARVGWQV